MSSSFNNKFDDVIDLKCSESQTNLTGTVFASFDRDRDDFLNLSEFSDLCQHLFCNVKGESYPIEAKYLSELFYIFDRNDDGKIDFEEFKFCWENWIAKVLWPVSCLLAVDIQNDFISGSLALKNCPACQDGAEIIPIVNELIRSVSFHHVMYSLDWHPQNHISFFDNLKNRKLDADSKISVQDAKLFDTVIFEGPPKVEQKLWPVHCVQNSWGSKLHDDLIVKDSGKLIYKGTHPDIDSYSVFWDNSKLSQTNLHDEISSLGVTDLYICGLAYDVCVGFTANDSLDMGYRTIVIEDATKGVDHGDIICTKDKLHSQDAVIVTSSEVNDMVNGLDRRFKLAYRSALRLAK